MSEEAAIGAVVDEMYAMISGPKGPRELVAAGELLSPRCAADPHVDRRRCGRATFRSMGLDDYARDTAPFFAENDFSKSRSGGGSMCSAISPIVWSAYEARASLDDALPERRGINSIQLFKDPDLGWRIMAMIWDNERDGVAIAPF